MHTSPPTLLQLSPTLPAIQQALDGLFTVVHLPPDGTDTAAREPLIAQHGPAVRAVVTGAHLGIDAALAGRLPSLGIVAINGVGFDRVDVAAMRARGVRVSHTPDVLTDDVADLAIALMLNVMRRLPAAEAHVRDGAWPGAAPPLTRRASGLRYGIAGFGRIGQAIATRLAGFGGSIAYAGPRPKPVAYRHHSRLADLAAWADVLFIATASQPDTQRMVDAAVLDALGPQGVLVNIARGAIVDEPALIAALEGGRIWGAGLDVFENEPHVPEALRRLPNVALAPHVGSATEETRLAMGRLMLDNLRAFLEHRQLPTEVPLEPAAMP